MTAAAGRVLELQSAFLPDKSEGLVRHGDRTLFVNLAPSVLGGGQAMPLELASIIANAKALASDEDAILRCNRSYETINGNVLAVLGTDVCRVDSIERLNTALALLPSQTRNLDIINWLPESAPPYDLARAKAIVRYGIVELRVIENYLADREALRKVVVDLFRSDPGEDRMLSDKRTTHFLSAGDMEFNVRRLMTNAGFYWGRSAETAWTNLEHWADRYLLALKLPLATCPPAYPFYWTIPRYMWEQTGAVPQYVVHPGPFQFYQSLQGEEVLFVSPLAEAVNAQFTSGRLRNLYKNYVMPEFNLRALPAPISTWPNRPHGSWTETFEAMCRDVDRAYAERPFTVFVASCGCYGLPICEYVFSKFGAKVLYLGNITNAYFGVRQQSTRNFMSQHVNPEMWVDGNLGDIPLLKRIDGGRYV